MQNLLNISRAFLLLLMIFILSSNSFAGVIFEENFDSLENWEPVSSSECTEGDCSKQVPVNWRYYRSMGRFNPNTTPSGHNTINISNEHFRGAGGKAFTVWTESAPEWSADGLLMADLGGEFEELYISFYIQFSPDWRWTDQSDGLLKIFRVLHYDGSGNIFNFFSTGNSCPIALWDVKHSLKWGWRHYMTNRCDPQETNYYCDANYDWDTLFPNSDDNDFKNSIGDGQWHHIELRIKLNTKTGNIWNHDGINQVWIDGILNGEKNNIQYLSGNTTWHGWNYIGIGGNQHNVFTDTSSGDEQWYAIDDITISTSPIPPEKTLQIIDIKITD